MDILRIAEAGRRHWVLISLGITLGIIFATVSAFKVVSTTEGRRIQARAAATYESRTRLLITEPNLDVARMNSTQGWPSGFTKTVEMAPTYALLVLGDDVQRAAEERSGPLPVRVTAQAVEKTPIIVVKATGTDAQQTVSAARAITDAFVRNIADQQDDHQVPENERVKVIVLSAPSTPRQVNSSAAQVGALAFLAPLLGSLALAVALERPRENRITAASSKHVA